jgi:hypothetical protein
MELVIELTPATTIVLVVGLTWTALPPMRVAEGEPSTGAHLAAASAAPAMPAQSCAETPELRATPPAANNAGSPGDGPWWVNTDRTLWLQSATGPWHAGYNQKNMMVKPADVKPALSGTRIDGPASPMGVKWVPQLHAEFQTMGLTFPTEGCWKVTATAGTHELSFFTVVRPSPAR